LDNSYVLNIQRGGGVAFVHADSIGVRPLDVGNPSSFEILAVRLTTRPTVYTTVACTYRPPGVVSRQFCSELADPLDQLVTAKQQFVICGDLDFSGTDGRQLDAGLVDVLQQWRSTSSMPRAATTHSN